MHAGAHLLKISSIYFSKWLNWNLPLKYSRNTEKTLPSFLSIHCHQSIIQMNSIHRHIQIILFFFSTLCFSPILPIAGERVDGTQICPILIPVEMYTLLMSKTFNGIRFERAHSMLAQHSFIWVGNHSFQFRRYADDARPYRMQSNSSNKNHFIESYLKFVKINQLYLIYFGLQPK